MTLDCKNCEICGRNTERRQLPDNTAVALVAYLSHQYGLVPGEDDETDLLEALKGGCMMMTQIVGQSFTGDTQTHSRRRKYPDPARNEPLSLEGMQALLLQAATASANGNGLCAELLSN